MSELILATLVYVVRDGQVLLLHRNKQPNLGQWVAPGGKLEVKESPHECAARELLEETGLEAGSLVLRGLITEVSPRDDYQWLIFIFVTRDARGELMDCESVDCTEGTLAWIPIEKVSKLNIPESDAMFYKRIISDGPLFRTKITYDHELGIVDYIIYDEPDVYRGSNI